MSVNAYVRAQKVAATPRSTEYRLMSEITSEMIAARDAGLAGVKLAPALHRNRQAWTIFRNLCQSPENGLPDELRAGIISLGLWVDKYTSLVITGREAIDELISVNRAVISGLSNENGAPA
ncbi:flagellar biosynthesis regulator FlaF [Novosphingobium sp. P6W]|uniref:flagellar biosynthesis regulator FlaF n=1 Tax=Novosphingobium sp. P6W TaxID=1609758 RepID=UPI0005C2C9D1|nr:flagellar biosynthesis regulator FlaF [Novosphingobium sp. P6W]AXB77961.1 flagellar biosynthesis regulatory protein FlaF [Novosphingobium sp. P6W]KIS32860.1 flagellar FlaF family protein [Novosphingobium sp. P6W]